MPDSQGRLLAYRTRLVQHRATCMATIPAAPAAQPTSGQPSGSIAWLLPFGLLVLATVVVPLRMLDEQGLPRYRALRSELRDIRADNERIRREVKQLRGTVDRLRDDPNEIERIARDELGMLRDGELLFQFPQ